MRRIADFRHSAGKFAGSDLERASVDRAGELSVSTRCGHPLLQTGRNKDATEKAVALQVHGNEAMDSAQI